MSKLTLDQALNWLAVFGYEPIARSGDGTTYYLRDIDADFATHAEICVVEGTVANVKLTAHVGMMTLQTGELQIDHPRLQWIKDTLIASAIAAEAARVKMLGGV